MWLQRRVLWRVLTWPLTPALLAGCVVVGLYDDEAVFGFGELGSVVALLACWLVGVVVTGRAPEQLAGWAFVGLATALAWSAFTDTYANLGFAGGYDVAGWRLMATLGDSSFVWWFVFLTLVLLWTPPAELRSRRPLAAVAIGCGSVFQVCALLRSSPLGAPRESLRSPLAVEAVDGAAQLVGAIAVYAVAALLLVSLGLLVGAWRRSEGESRQQLLWLVAGALPLAPAIVVAFASSAADRDDLSAIALSLAMVTLVSGAGLSVLRYRLYDVERVVTASAAYAIASVSVVLAFVAVVVVISRSTPIAAGSQLPTVAATLAGVATARFSYVWAGRAVARTVNRQRFDAVDAVRVGLVDATGDLDDLVVQALGPGARVVYPTASGAWVTSDGHEVQPRADAVEVRRRGSLTARIEYDPAESEPAVVEAVAAEAATEIDNVALRAELARQLDLITESRARLANAQLEERRRIERDLHDGAQQRLLALALQLRSARLNGDEGLLGSETDRAIRELQETVQELRDLAGGLLPASLAGGGLLAAVADMAGRCPVELHHDVPDARFPAEIEAAAWFVVAEAVTNVVKHSGAPEVWVTARRTGETVEVDILDHGSGGADPSSRGLQGLADRVSATGGVLTVQEAEPQGTLVKAVFPCAS